MRASQVLPSLRPFQSKAHPVRLRLGAATTFLKYFSLSAPLFPTPPVKALALRVGMKSQTPDGGQGPNILCYFWGAM